MAASGRVGEDALTERAVWQLVREYAQQVGIGELAPHDLRRTFISDLLDVGVDLSTVQRLAGHAQVTTTTRYDRRGEATKRKAASMLHVPYERRTTPVVVA